MSTFVTDQTDTPDLETLIAFSELCRGYQTTSFLVVLNETFLPYQLFPGEQHTHSISGVTRFFARPDRPWGPPNLL